MRLTRLVRVFEVLAPSPSIVAQWPWPPPRRFSTGTDDRSASPGALRLRALTAQARSSRAGRAPGRGSLSAKATSRSPTRELERCRASDARSRALKSDEQARWYLGLAEDEIVARQNLVDFSAVLPATGLRIGEAPAVLSRDVDLNTGVLTTVRAEKRAICSPPEAVNAGSGAFGRSCGLAEVA